MRGTGAALVVLLVACVGAGTVGASDAISVFQYQPDPVEAEPGETVTVDVHAWSGGGAHEIGIERATATVRYDPDVLALAAVDHGDWLARGNDTTVRTDHDVDEADGAVEIDQRREPPAGGATGEGVFATLTFEVAADAPAGEHALGYGPIDVQLVNGHYLPVHEDDGTLVVDGAASGPPVASRDGLLAAGVLAVVAGALLARQVRRQ